MSKLLIKITDFVQECEELYDIKLIYRNTMQINHVKSLERNFKL